MKIPLKYSFRNLWMRKLTTSLTVGGIGLVVFVFAAVLMLAQGLRETLVGTGSEENVIVIRKSATTELLSAVSRESAGIIRNFPEVVQSGPGRALVSTELVVIINIFKIGTNDMGNVLVRGVSPEAFTLRSQVRMTEGRAFTPGKAEVVIGSSIHERFQGCSIGERLKFGGREWTIVGIFDGQKSGFDSEVWGDIEQLLPAFGRPVFSAMTCRLTGNAAFDSFKSRLEADPRLRQLEAKREVTFYSEQSEMMAMFISILGLAITILFSFGAMIGAMITMYAAVSNRTSEIGTLRALGFRRRNVLFSFLIESLLIALIGGGIGVAIASVLQTITVSTTNWGTFSELAFGFALTPEIALNSLLFALVMGTVGGFLPAVRASRLAIINALRAE